MRVLFLGYPDSPLIDWLRSQGEEVVATAERIDVATVQEISPDFIVSYGYDHIIRGEVLDLLKGNAINLHISYLPFNKGRDPNFWSFVEGTPKGVTIHYLDETVDGGDIIVQELAAFHDHETLATSYYKLRLQIECLFQHNWKAIRAGTCGRTKQPAEGTSHRRLDLNKLRHLLSNGWDTPVEKLTAKRLSNETQD